MDTRNAVQWIVAVLIVMEGISSPVCAAPVFTYGGDFNLPLLDPTGPGSLMTEATIEIIDTFIITDLDVSIDITHTKVFDLQLFLQGPEGSIVCLNQYNFNEFFEGANYTRTVFDDEAEVPIEEGQPPFTGRFRPKAIDALNMLGVFEGDSIYGTWRLQIHDMWPSDTGVLDSFELVITIPEPTTAAFLILGTGFFALFKSRRS